MRRLGLVLPAIASVLACTLIDSRDGLVGPPIDASTGGDGGDAATRDAPFETAAPDGGDGGKVPITLYDGRSAPAGIAVSGNMVYWVERATEAGTSAGLLAASSDGTGTPAHLDEVGDNIGDAFDLAFDGTTYVYWGDRSNGLVWRKAAGSAKQQCFPGAPSAAYLALGGGGVYVTDFREDDAGAGNGSIVFGPCPGSANVVFLGRPLAAGIGVAADTVAWGRAMPNEIETSLLDSGVAGTLSSTAGPITGLAIDATAVYWIESNQRIMKADISSRIPVTLYDAQADFGESDVAVDDAAIYWTEQKNGRIRKLAK